MNFSELQRELNTLIKDTSPEVKISVPDLINEAIETIAEKIVFPSLKTVITLTTSTTLYYVNMPSNFSGRLLYCGNSDGKITILDNGIDGLLELYPALDEVGDVSYVALEGNILYYQGIPSVANTLICLIYTKPTTLINDNDTPSFIPSMYHRDTIVYKAAEKAYDMIEDALELKMKLNTAHYRNAAKVGMEDLGAWAVRRRNNISTSFWGN